MKNWPSVSLSRVELRWAGGAFFRGSGLCGRKVAPTSSASFTRPSPDRSSKMPIVNRIAEFHPEIREWRRDLHAHPELLFDVHRTAKTVADKLKAFGCDEVVPGIGRTGVVGVIRGRKDAPDKVIGLRADMDALPIEEATG